MGPKIIGIGEVLWDLLPAGPQLGGAPANFAYHAHALGAEACVISRIGRDALGRELLARFETLGLPQHTLQFDESAATGTVRVTLNHAGLPEYIIEENVAWDRLEATSADLAAVRGANAVCFGTLAQRNEKSRASIRQLLASASTETWRVLDLNLRQHFYTPSLIEESLRLADILKLNEDELSCLGGMFGIDGDLRERVCQLAARYGLRIVACTRGAHGSLIFTEGRWSEHPGVAADVSDTVGAGDAFTAAMILGLLAGWGLDAVSQQANELAAYVASCPGATPVLPQDLVGAFKW